jgi:hypothetical protein
MLFASVVLLASAALAQAPGGPPAGEQPSPEGLRLGLSVGAVAGVDAASRGGALGPVSGASFLAELGAYAWPRAEWHWLLGLSGGVGKTSDAGGARVSFNFHTGWSDVDTEFGTAWTRRGFSFEGFGGLLDVDGVLGWRVGLLATLPFGGLARLAHLRIFEDGGLLGGSRGCGGFGGGGSAATAVALVLIAFIAVIVAVTLVLVMNEVQLSVETLDPPGLPPQTTASVMLGITF